MGVEVRPVIKLALLSFAVGVLAIGASGAAAADTAVECGAYFDYTAPDPVAATAGSITFGLSGSPEPIAPDANLVPPADSALPGLQGGTPTCLAVTRDAGVITALAFAPSGTISGPVILVPNLFGSGQDGYVVADRVIAPVDVVTANPGLAALIKTAADSGSTLSMTFQIDLTTGVPTSFTATTSFAGAMVLLPSGDITVGGATLPDAVIGVAERGSLTEAAQLGVPATVVVDAIATLEQGGAGGVFVDITLLVTYTAPASATPSPSATPTPAAVIPNTAATPSTGTEQPPLRVLLVASLLMAGLLAGARLRRTSRTTRLAR